MNVEELEKLRIKVRNKTLIGIFITIIVSIILLLITQEFRIIFFCIVFGIIITYITTHKQKREFILEYKKIFVLKSLESIFTNLLYLPEAELDEGIIRETGMMHMGDRYSSNDYIKGKYKNIDVEQADVHIEEEHVTTDSDGNTHRTWVTIFKGRWMIFDFNKTFKANLQVCQKGFGNAKISNWGNDLKYKRVKMEDEIFNKSFRIYAQSEHEDFYILTPHLMEKIKNLTNTVHGKILLCFVDNKLHVGIQNNKDSFEPSIYTKINEANIIESVSKDIKLITNFVDELDLDNDLFRKVVE